MKDRRNEDRLYTVVLLAFLLGLVVLGLLGVPAPLVVAAGLGLAALGIAALHGRNRKVPPRYVPSVLEASSTKRRRIGGLKRQRHASTPLRFR
jgi:hypothetical protein